MEHSFDFLCGDAVLMYLCCYILLLLICPLDNQTKLIKCSIVFTRSKNLSLSFYYLPFSINIGTIHQLLLWCSMSKMLVQAEVSSNSNMSAL